MRRWIRRSLFGLLTLAALLAVALALAAWRGQQRLDQRLDLAPRPVALRSDAAALERGRYLFGSLGCAGCHGPGGAGKVMWDNGANVLRSTHIAPGPGSVTAQYAPADWERAIRHGLRPDGRPLLQMPSVEFSRLADDDLGALVAHIRQLPEQSSSGQRHQLGLLMKVLIGIGRMPLSPDPIDHSRPPVASVAIGDTAEHGRYVAQTCVGCHGPDLAGGPIPGMPPGTPPAARLSPGEASAMPRYADVAAFRTMLQTGRRPDGSIVSTMPSETFARMSDIDVAALHRYLHGKTAADAARP